MLLERVTSLDQRLAELERRMKEVLAPSSEAELLSPAKGVGNGRATRGKGLRSRGKGDYVCKNLGSGSPRPGIPAR